MKLSSETLAILKNFGNINQGIYFKKGKTLKTVSPHMNILAEAEIDEEIPVNFGIYDLNAFLSVVTLHKDVPTFDFDEKNVLIVGNNNRSKIKFRFCDPTMINVPPERELAIPAPQVSFDLTHDDFNWILRASAVLGTPQISVESDGSKVYLLALDTKNDSSHTDSLEIADGDGATYSVIFKTENLTKIMAGSYRVSVSSEGAGTFIHQSIKLKYIVSVEDGSTYTPK